MGRFYWGFVAGGFTTGIFHLLTLPPEKVEANTRAWLRFFGLV